MTWNEAGGTVSQTFDRWRYTDAQNRAYLRLSAEWSHAAYVRTWKEAEASANAAFDPDRHYGDEHVDVFDHAVDGLWPTDYLWLSEASVLKAAVTAFEVYLEQALQEFLNGYRVTVDGQKCALQLVTPKNFESPGWSTLVRAHMVLKNTVDTPEVTWARELRHLLTHQNGELRTQDSLEKFRDTDAEKDREEIDRAYVGGKVHLGAERVSRTLDELASVIRAADPVVWSLVWGSGRGEDGKRALAALDQAKLIETGPAR
ncbi:hypothetical protein [Streptomyces globisporus]|uniref:hypothetical protein n=1 Tax=Streptomyces globisporus TaxID=1908 RepID=UPI002F916957|nr:hypothetical protein OG425_35015 [Streptomyces globisporus]WSV94699.1 hypothetical protein OG449_35840 [Streptomyces globisporus]